MPLMYKNDQELPYAAPADTSFSFTSWQHSSVWNDVMAAISKCDIKLKIKLHQI